ncbi:hypothetical protein [Desulfovibrio sp. MES5]|uniref:hypothetical protein n=1 Tax=Desulfovibrio sp. MES5 TaxID=1899016 RepID=UPI0025B9181A|nr:hypothetical protein [Desulfovibrio sp. MES5]
MTRNPNNQAFAYRGRALQLVNALAERWSQFCARKVQAAPYTASVTGPRAKPSGSDRLSFHAGSAFPQNAPTCRQCPHSSRNVRLNMEIAKKSAIACFASCKARISVFIAPARPAAASFFLYEFFITILIC